MKKHLTLISAVILGLFTLGTISALAAGGGDPIIPTEISPEEAAKKYPLPAGKKSYPEGMATTTTTGGFFKSPYSSNVYDCRKVKRGAVILDENVNKVFLRP